MAIPLVLERRKGPVVSSLALAGWIVRATILVAQPAPRLAQPGSGILFSEDFDGVTAPALPYGWAATNAQGPDPMWLTNTANPSSAPNAVFIDDPAAVSDKRLDSPPIAVLTAGAQLSFRHWHDFAFDVSGGSPDPDGIYYLWFDGGVLEISINGGDFTDILDAGGVFLEGGYGPPIDGPSNPLLGRAAFVGYADYHTTTVGLPTAAAGASVVLRWRMGASFVGLAAGWYIDDVKICDGFVCDAVPLPIRLDVDSAGNGVLEPGEITNISPTYANYGVAPFDLTGTASMWGGPPGTTVDVEDATASYGTLAPGAVTGCADLADCYVFGFDDGGARPVQHWDEQFWEYLSATTGTVVWALHIGGSFDDVPASNPFYKDVETVFHRRVTGGCGGTGYCPGSPALRKQMAVFLLKSKYGAAYVPPPAAGIFADVPASDPFAPWVENLYALGITGGCGSSPLTFCPDQTVLRKQMAVFLLKTLNGTGYVPPACQGVFADVPCPSPFADWIEELYAQQIAAGCGNGAFCPDNPNTRGQMAVFLAKTFAMTLYGP